MSGWHHVALRWVDGALTDVFIDGEEEDVD